MEKRENQIKKNQKMFAEVTFSNLLTKELTFDEKYEKYCNYLKKDNGLKKIRFPSILESLITIKEVNGKPIPETVDSLARTVINMHAIEQQIEPILNEAHLSEYGSLYQKNVFFVSKQINTFKDFILTYEKLNEEKNIIYRGINEAKYQLYSSLQRFWILNNLSNKEISYNKFIKKLIRNALDDNCFNEFINHSPKNHLSILSFLQHYRTPTPLMDWTLSIDAALLFGLHGINSKIKNKREIEDYFSLYFIDIKHFKYIDFKLRLKIDLKYIIDRCVKEKIITKEKSVKKAAFTFLGDVLKKFHTYDIEKIFEEEVWYFSDYNGEEYFNLNLINNPNIRAQLGTFTINNNPTKPLEHIANIQLLKNEKTKPKGQNIISSEIICNSFEINKNLAPKISEFLTSKGYFYKDLFPEPMNTKMVEICNEIFNKTKNDFGID